MSDYDGSVDEIAQHSPHTRWAGDDVHGRYPVTIRVWVRLDAIVARIPGQPHHVIPDGLDMTGEVPGLLTTWFASARGDWCGCSPGLKLTVDRRFLADCDDSP